MEVEQLHQRQQQHSRQYILRIFIRSVVAAAISVAPAIAYEQAQRSYVAMGYEHYRLRPCSYCGFLTMPGGGYATVPVDMLYTAINFVSSEHGVIPFRHINTCAVSDMLCGFYGQKSEGW